MNLGLSGKKALVTAASAGIGLACAKALAAEGVKLCLSSRSIENLEKAREIIEQSISDSVIELIPCDMADADSVKKLCDTVSESFGQPDIFVNNTGGPKAGRFFDIDQAEWERSYHLMVGSTVLLYNRLIPGMRRQGWGRVVNITSTSSRQPIDGLVLSNSFRPGLLGLAKSVANEIGKDGVTINTVMPGITLTARMEELSQGREDSIVHRLQRETAIGRAASPAEQAAAVVYLCSEQAAYITGSALAVDGGAVRCI
jgi:3-oxoacyl-[acyl-carrier protein] reductase